jgi:hypothetical protein
MVAGSFPFGVYESGLIFQPGAAVVLPAWHVVQGAQPLDLGGIDCCLGAASASTDALAAA